MAKKAKPSSTRKRTSTTETHPKFIENRRTRNACFSKRQIGFLKKAVHLSVNTGSDIAIIVRRNVDGETPPLVFASNGDLEGIFQWWMKEQSELRTVSSSLLTEHSNELQSKMTITTNETIANRYWNSVTLESNSQTLDESSTAEMAEQTLMISLPPPCSPENRPEWPGE
jgi:hypothetical protein